MRFPRAKAAGFSAVAVAAALLAWAIVGAHSAPASVARAASCQGAEKACCQADNQREQRRKLLRQKNAQQKRPNVIVIETDDQNASDMFVMAQTLGLLGARGTSFSNAYVSYPLCCPSRATFLTGQYNHNNGVLTDQRYGDLDNSNTLATWMRRAKYRTAMVGKYLNGYGVLFPTEVPPGWSQWFAMTDSTDQKRYHYRLNENGRIHRYGKGARNYVTD